MKTETKPKKQIRWNVVKKVVLLLVLVGLVGTIAWNRDLFYVNYPFKATDQPVSERTEISMLGSQEVQQEFIARTSDMVKAKISFKAWEPKNGSGIVHVELRDLEDNVLATQDKKVTSLVQSKGGIGTTFALEAAMVKGDTYKIVIRTEDAQSDKGIYLYSTEDKGILFGDLTVNGEPAEGRICMTITMGFYAWNSMSFMAGFILIGLLFIFFPYGKAQAALDRRLKGRSFDLNKLLARILFVAAPVLSFFIVQRFSEYGIKQFLKMMIRTKGILNLLLYFLIWGLIYLISNRTRVAAALTVILSFALGLTNYFVWEFRGTPIMAGDLASIDTAFNVAGSYVYELNLSSLWSVVYAVVFLVCVLSLKSYKGLPLKKRACALVVYLVPFGFFYTQLLNGSYLADHNITVSVFNPNTDYAKNGSLLSFFMSYTYYRMDTPKSYSADKVEEVAAKYQSDSVTDGDGVRPNVIAIMNESFCDLNANATLETSDDFMPFIHSLTEDTVKGDLYVSVFGGNTANSEFEFLTGSSMIFFPYRAIPYNTYIKHETPSLTSSLVAQGYTGNYAIHPYKRSGWNREAVYNYFGFSEFFSREAFDDFDTVYMRAFISDESDFNYIISKYEEVRAENTEDPFYTFSVTMQNHGGYANSLGRVETEVTITDPEQWDDQAEQYINLVRASDEAFEDLVSYFQEVEEPTVIIMFGDHQPSLPATFYTGLFQKSAGEMTLEDTIRKHTVPYVIWANYDIEEKEVNLSANYLSAFFLDTIGSPLTGYQKYLLDLYEKLPMITANGYRGDDEVLYEVEAESDYKELLDEYEMIQYNNIFDASNRIEEFFRLAE